MTKVSNIDGSDGPASPVEKLPDTTPLRQIPGLLACLGTRTLAAFASQIQAVAIGWQIYAMTHKVVLLGLVGLAQFLPMIICVFPAGHVADHFSRRRIVMICQIMEAMLALSLATLSFMHALTPFLICLIVALFGVCRSFEMPAQQTFLPNIVPAEVFPRAAALGSSLFQVASIAGPSLGGVLYGFGAGGCYIVCAAGFMSALLCTSSLHLGSDSLRVRQPITIESLFGGIVFLRSQPALLGAISLDLFAVLLGGATAMLPVYADDILHAGPLGLGLLRAAPAMGAVLMAVFLSFSPLKRHAGRIMFLSVAIFGLTTILFALSRSVFVSVLALAILGAADVISVMVRGTLVQLRTPDAMRGRVSAVNMLFIGSSNQLGEFESGMLAAAIGTVPSVVAGGVGTLLVTLLWMKIFPDLRRLDRLDDIRPADL
ncbi:MAG: MFS transporter [Acetobacter sp.]|jgi:MFS family permease|nr:MFS transporter [Acetobacter sp.]MCH4061066.1 MFS transporter [Acetobacter sp.]MCH4088005.1 MFS transporter [Acetobacter sp.]MCI1293382.1 MFS transporter [Acetobacter sp.]MCI1319993.1 MFS transporter [Acetobacter sp.]